MKNKGYAKPLFKARLSAKPLLYMKIIFYSHVNKLLFTTKMKARVLGTHEWPQVRIVAIALTERSHSPVLPHSPTRSLKQDSQACGGG